MKPIQGPSRQSVVFPASDAKDKDPAYIQTPSSTEQPQQSETSKDHSSQVADAKLQGNLRASQLNSAYQHHQSDLEYI